MSGPITYHVQPFTRLSGRLTHGQRRDFTAPLTARRYAEDLAQRVDGVLLYSVDCDPIDPLDKPKVLATIGDVPNVEF